MGEEGVQENNEVETLLMHEVEVGQDYELVITTRSFFRSVGYRLPRIQMKIQ